jgi:hypothetical protein
MEQEEGRRVRNQDIPLLTQIFYILKEAESVERRGEWTYERLFNITRRMTGMPIGGGNAPGMDGTLAEVEELNRIYGDRLQECVKALKDAERILNGIESQTMRTFVQMYYIDDISKAEIMRELNMTEWKFNKARENIENAENMKKVVWKEKFCILENEKK